MKLIKHVLYILGVLLSIGIVLIASVLVTQLGIEGIAKIIGTSIKENLLFSISGSMGTVITGSILALYVKKKGYTECIKVKKPFQLKSCVYYSAIALSVCSILFYVITTFVFVNIFSMTGESYVAVEESGLEIIVTDFIFPVLLAPIFEELLFRKGLYSLMRHRFENKVAILLCTLIFAAMHGYSIQGFCMCLIAGLVFMLIYIRTGNIWYSIVAHSISNLGITIMNVLEDKGIAFLGIPIQYEVSGFHTVHPVLAVIAAIFCSICIIKKVRNTEK